MKLQLWADGSCDNGDGIGAYAFCVVNTKTDFMMLKSSEACEDTTNNREEIKSVYYGLIALNNFIKMAEPGYIKSIEVVSDSAYVVNCFKQGWFTKWRRNGWRTAQGDIVKNKDLWDPFTQLVEKFKVELIWTHVKGHQKKGKQPWNDLCDDLAGSTRKGYLLKLKEENSDDSKESTGSY